MQKKKDSVKSGDKIKEHIIQENAKQCREWQPLKNEKYKGESGMLLKEEGGEIDDNFNLAKILNCTGYKEFLWPMSKSLCKIKEWKCT